MRVVSRREWGAQFTIPGGRHVPPASRRFFVVHWPATNNVGNERQLVRSIEAQHRRQGWAAAPGYNYLVGMSGTIYEGCGRDVRGIHSPPRNTDGFGVCILAPMDRAPSAAALRATRQLYDHLNRVTGRTLGRRWHAQDFATQCPGQRLIAWVRNGMLAPGAPSPPGGGGGGVGPIRRPAPSFPGRILINRRPMMQGADVRQWQTEMRARGWTGPPRSPAIAADGWYGPISEDRCRQFQRRMRLAVDGRVGPNTWRATWERPIL
jgi:hypothetical protein